MSTTSATQADTLQELLFKPMPLADAAQVAFLTESHRSSAVVAANSESGMAATERSRAIDATRQAIATLQQTRGAFEADLAEQYLSLGRLYQQAAEYDAAIEHYSKAEHINRVTHGLYGPEQFLPIELSIECHLARGEFAAAMERREYLV
ncbi:MAG: tetratricopeptide repeat protein, partial [Pseudomonadota bacterium]|nr:tetratricopeptide repeat protein [Pseudomonadota bacterium]